MKLSEVGWLGLFASLNIPPLSAGYKTSLPPIHFLASLDPASAVPSLSAGELARAGSAPTSKPSWTLSQASVEQLTKAIMREAPSGPLDTLVQRGRLDHAGV